MAANAMDRLDNLVAEIKKAERESDGTQTMGNMNVKRAMSKNMSEKEIKETDGALDVLENESNKQQYNVISGSSPIGPAKMFKPKSDADKEVKDAASYLNSRPGLQKSVRERLTKEENSGSGEEKKIIYPLNGGSIEGEFNAIFNTHNLERATSEMTGGGPWAPALDKEATSRADSFEKILKAIYKELASVGKGLSGEDKTALDNAIESLRNAERQAYTNGQALQRYLRLQEKYRNTKNEEIKQALKDLSVQDFLNLYNKNMGRADRKSKKLMVVLTSLFGGMDSI